MRISDWSSDVCSSDLSGLARELRRVVAHGAPITFAERMDGVDLVDVVAEPVEKLVSRKSAKAALRAHVGKPLVEFTRDIGHGCEARAALGDVDGPVLPRPIIEVLKQMLVKRAIAVGRRWKSQARGLCAARLR